MNTLTSSVAGLQSTLSSQSVALSQLQGIVTELQANQNNPNTTNISNPNIIESGSIIYSGSTEWTHSGILLAELTGSGISGSTYTGILVTPRDAILYISNLFDQSTNIIHDFVALQVTAVHGYFSEVWTEKVNTKELVASGAIIGQAHLDTLCVKKSNGTEFCLTGDQLESMLGSSSITSPSNTTASLTPIVTSTGSITESGSIVSSDSGAMVPSTTEIVTSSGTTDFASAPEVIVPPEDPVSMVTDSGATQP